MEGTRTMAPTPVNERKRLDSHQGPRDVERATETETEGEVYYGSNEDYDVLGGRRLKMNTVAENVYNLTVDSCSQGDYAHAGQFSRRESNDEDDLYDHTSDDKYGTIVTANDNNSLYGQSQS